MPQFVFSNFISTTLSAAATSTDTSLSVTSATNFPTLETGQQLPITLINAATQTVYEIIYVTAISGTTLTVLRGQEGTVAQAWSIGDLVKGCITAATVSPSPGTHSPVSSETLPVTLGTLKVTPGTLTEDITLTTPNAGDPGSETTIYGSASAYTTTVSTGVTSGSPYIELPDGSQVYSYVIPASSPGAGIRLDFDGTNYRATTFGPTIVANASVANQAVALGQFINSFGSAGYAKLPGGLIIQWTQVTGSIGAATTFSWPIAFPGGCLSVATTDGGSAAYRYGVIQSATGGTLYAEGGTAGNSAGAHIIAVGF